MNRDKLKALLMDEEGLRLKPYKDSEGKLTIGYGRCLDTKGITAAEAEAMLDDDISDAVAECRRALPWFTSLDDSRQNAVASMVFNIGLGGFLTFKNMISAIESRDFEKAANELLCSKYAGQTGRRAVELAEMIKNGDTRH